MDNSQLATAAENIKNELIEAIEKDDLVFMKKMSLCFEAIIQEEYGQLHQRLVSLGVEKLIATCKNRAKAWLESLKVGDVCEVFDDRGGKWHEAKILSRDGDFIEIHYLGWHAKFDQTINTKQEHIGPCYLFTKPKKPSVKTEKKKTHEIIIVEESDAAVTTTESDAAEDPAMVSKAGRRIRAAAVAIHTEPEPKKARTAPKEDGGDDKNDWICSICSMYESEDGTDLLMCDGPCMRSFHHGCLPAGTNTDEEDDWFCSQCVKSAHSCFVCGEIGEDYLEVNKCNVKACGKFYHKACLLNPQATFVTPTVDSATKEVALPGQIGRHSTAARRTVETFVFKCPSHFCDTCSEFYKTNSRNSSDRHVNRCIMCPRSFHTNCIPPATRFTSLCLLCPLHPDQPLPDQPAGLFSGGKDSAEEEEDIPDALAAAAAASKRKKHVPSGSVALDFFEQLMVPDLIPNANNPHDHHFKLLTSIKDDTENVVAGFKMMGRNDYSTLPGGCPPANHSQVCCECKVICDENCLNRVSRFECCEVKVSRDTDAVCNVGPHCSNRQLQNREYAHVEVFREYNRGCGLRAKSAVAKGSLIIEYVGEVIDFQEVVRRMTHQREHSPSDHDFYIMELDNGLYVDGKFKGNNSRYINHSCGPNCELQRWEVKGQPRIAIVALQDIAAGEAFSYDYQFDTNEASTFQCFCGSEQCRGTMAPKKKADKGAGGIPSSKADRAKLIAVGRSMEVRSYETMVEDETNRSYTGKYIPGDPLNEIKNGPVRTALEKGRDQKLFLVRNVKQSLNFMDRKHALMD